MSPPEFDLPLVLEELAEASSDDERLRVLKKNTVGFLVRISVEELCKIIQHLESLQARRRCLRALAPRVKNTRRMDYLVTTCFPGEDRKEAVQILKNVLPGLQISERGFSPSHLSDSSPMVANSPMSPLADAFWEQTPRNRPSLQSSSSLNGRHHQSPVWPTSSQRAAVWSVGEATTASPASSSSEGLWSDFIIPAPAAAGIKIDAVFKNNTPTRRFTLPADSIF